MQKRRSIDSRLLSREYAILENPGSKPPSRAIQNPFLFSVSSGSGSSMPIRRCGCRVF
jgi:hypothetical protein